MRILGSTLVVFVIAFVSWTKGIGLNKYAGYKDPCLVGGPEKYAKQYKYHKDTFWGNFTERYNGKLCNSLEYLLCYNENGSDTNGVCDCNNQHSRGYVLVYDATTEVKQCRGYINSTCGRAVECYTGLECQIRKGCQCPSSGCPTVPLPRSFSPKYDSANGSIEKVNFIVLALILIISFCDAAVFT